jgi:predicted DNA-binding protein
VIMDEETKQIAIRLPLSLVTHLEEQARADRRTLANLVRKILIEHYEQEAQHEQPSTKKRRTA